jgi:putative endonuclease
LTRKGFNVVARNYSVSFGEIDLIAKKGNLLVFVEVKCRKQQINKDSENPESSINANKIRKIKKTASFFIKQQGLDPDGNYRFDAISIIIGNKVISLKHILYAF